MERRKQNIVEEQFLYVMTSKLRSNYLPLHFHHVHGDNIKLSKNRTVACRLEGFCDGIVFSDRPVMISEPVYVKLLRISPNWSGTLRIGFTMNDPMFLKSKLPRYSCPDLTHMYGNWVKSFIKNYEKDSILYYYADQNGDVHYGIDSDEYGIFFGGVNISGELWAVLDVYGNAVAVELMDPNALNHEYKNGSLSRVPTSRSQKRASFQTLLFHTIHGKNVTLKANKAVVYKKFGIRSIAYVFTKSPVELDETIMFRVQHVDPHHKGLFVYGITSYDPNEINPIEISENDDDLFDRSKCLFVNKRTYPIAVGDYLTFKIHNKGQAEFSINGATDTIFVVDSSQPLWLFINLTNSITKPQIAGLSCNFCSTNEEVDETFNNLAITEYGKTGFGPASPSGQQESSECIICCEEQVDCALYQCGHMCMCYDCASKLFSSGSNAECPICRNTIKDVIKVYK